jgi:chromate transport protein ChrA
VSNLVTELLLRLVKPLVAVVLGALVYLLATGPLGEPASVSLALLSWVSAAAFVLLVESSLF